MTASPLLGVMLAFAAVALAPMVGWLIAGIFGWVIARIRGLRATTRATFLAQARLMPLALMLLIVPAQTIGFARFELGGAESAGPLLIGLAILGLAFLADGLTSGVRSWRHTRIVVRAWRMSATPLTLPSWARRAWTIRRRFPVVAVVGVVRPQLFVARQVIAECTPSELAAIAAHESAHVDAGDNLLRLLFRLTPGASVAARVGDPIERAWMVAAEEAADERARSRDDGVELASALTKVARMAAESDPEVVPVSALIQGNDLAHRVRRLLESHAESSGIQWGWIGLGFAVVLGIILQTTPVAFGLHEAFEMLVRH
jgi:Zn-dependent protease with chaperone function